jgi:hypothetical protein
MHVLRNAIRVLAALGALALVPAPAGAGTLAPTKAQQKCISAFGKAALGVAKARAAEDQRCLRESARGSLAALGAASLRSCMARDSKGKLAKRGEKLAQVAASSCSAAEDVPPFGLGAGGATRVARNVAKETTGASLDLLSENLFASALSCDADPAGCACQAAVTGGAGDLAKARLSVFERCAKRELRAGVSSAAGLAACLADASLPGSVADDPKGKLAKQVTKLGKKIEQRCGGALAEAPFPGQCVGLEGDALAACADEVAACRSCLALNAIHGLDVPCDAFDDGDDDASCPGGAVAQQTALVPSAAQPPETPGTPSVVVVAPKLLAQFGGGDFDLNHGIYTRYHFRNPPVAQPDAVLVLVPGFEGGASGFKVLAENLIPRVFAESGLVVEVWAFDRRSHQLEDLEGLDLAEAEQDPQLALDWLFGDELGLPPNVLGRRAQFHDPQGDIPFLANWTPLVHSRDIDAVVETARAWARDQNVFLGGHSAGTGFAARYAATDFDLTGAGPAQPGYAKLRGLVLIEGGGGSTAGAAPDADTLDLIEARFAGGLFGAVRDGAPRCMDGATPCTPETEDLDCAAFEFDQCVEPMTAYFASSLLQPQLLAAAEPVAIQAHLDPDAGQAILQVDQGGVPSNKATTAVAALNVLNLLPPATAQGLVGLFVDDEGFGATAAQFIATSVGAVGPEVDGLVTWLDTDEASAFPACPGGQCVTPDNGPEPTAFPAGVWGEERESIRFDRFIVGLYTGGTNFTDWYYPWSGLAVTNGLPSLDSSALSLDPPAGRGRRDIENLTQAAAIDIPVIGLGGSNGLTPVDGSFTAFASSIAPCAAASCDGSTPRVVDPAIPSAAFPDFGDVAGGFEAHVSVGLAHVDPLAAEDGTDNQVVGPLADFLVRNSP